MRLTKRQLKRIIREEYSRIVKESRYTEEPAGPTESNDVLQFIEDALENWASPDEISSELLYTFSLADLEAAVDSEEIVGWSMAEAIINVALR